MGNAYPAKQGKGTSWQGTIQLAYKPTAPVKDRKWLTAVLTLEARRLSLRNEQGSESVLCEQVSEASLKLVRESFQRQEVLFAVLHVSTLSLYHIRFPSLRSHLSWKSALTASIQPLWESPALKYCHLCSKAFSAIRRQHHCRLCGRVVCAACSQFRAQVPWSAGLGKERACGNCVGRLMEDSSPLRQVICSTS